MANKSQHKVSVARAMVNTEPNLDTGMDSMYSFMDVKLENDGFIVFQNYSI